MDASSVLLKLLPLTHSTQDGVELIALSLEGQYLGDWLISIVIVLLLALFGWQGSKLYRSYRADKRKIDFLHNSLKEYKDRLSENLDEFNARLKSFDNNGEKGELYLLWNEFNESLIKSNNKFTGAIEYRNSLDAEYFFHKKNLLTHLGTKLYASVPSMLLGIGLIGTFLGLFVGLVQLNIDDANTLKESMKALIHAAGVKFASSIWGLLLSLIFTWLDKKWENSLETQIDEIQELVNFEFERRTSEQSLEDIYEASILQKDALQGLASTLTEQLSRELNASLTPRLDAINSGFGRLSEDISGAIVKSLEAPLQKISETVQNAAKNQANQSGEMLESLVERFIVKLDKTAGAHSETFKNNIEATQLLMAQVAQNLTDYMQLTRETFNEQNRINSDRDRLIIDNLEQIRQSQNETIKTLTESVKDNIISLTDHTKESIEKIEKSLNAGVADYLENANAREEKLNENLGHIIQRIDETTEKMSQDNSRRDERMLNALAEIDNTFQKAVHNIQVSTNEAMASVASRLDESIKNLKLQIDNILINIGSNVGLIDNIIKTSADRLSNVPNHLQTLDNSASKLQSFSTKIDSSSSALDTAAKDLLSVADAAKEYFTGLTYSADLLQQTVEKTEVITEKTENTFSLLAKQYDDILITNKKSVDEFMLSVKSFLDEYQRSAQDGIQKTFNTFDSQLSQFATSMSDAVNELNDAINELADRVGK